MFIIVYHFNHRYLRFRQNNISRKKAQKAQKNKPQKSQKTQKFLIFHASGINYTSVALL